MTNNDLPDLGSGNDAQTQADNLRAMQTIYFAALLDDLQVFQVVDTIVELFLQGQLPLATGSMRRPSRLTLTPRSR